MKKQVYTEDPAPAQDDSFLMIALPFAISVIVAVSVRLLFW